MMRLRNNLNVVHFEDAYEDDRAVYMVMEHCSGGDHWVLLLLTRGRVTTTLQHTTCNTDYYIPLKGNNIYILLN